MRQQAIDHRTGGIGRHDRQHEIAGSDLGQWRFAKAGFDSTRNARPAAPFEQHQHLRSLVLQQRADSRAHHPATDNANPHDCSFPLHLCVDNLRCFAHPHAMTSVIDSHLLIASRDLARFPLAAGVDPAEIEGSPGRREINALLDGRELAGAVLVQRGRQYGYDNALICAAAAADPRLRAVCAVDGRSDDCGDVARDLLARPGVVGLRLMEPEKGASLDWLCGPGARDAWRAAADAGAVMDVHVFPWNRLAGLEELEKLLAEYSGLRVVLDNLGNPALEDGPPDFGVDDALVRVAGHRQVTLKVSAMSFARASKAELEPAALLEAMVARFGASRLCWGSDVLLGGATPESAIAEARQAAAGLSDKDAAMVLSSTARALFDLD